MAGYDESLLNKLETRIKAFTPDSRYPDDHLVVITLNEAIAAAREGNFGVGAVLVLESGEIVQRGHNRVFKPYFRSDLHAEMDVMTNFEQRFKDKTTVKGLILYSSLEPCPMCFTRLITSGVNKVYYAAQDEPGGMVSRSGDMPPIWHHLAQKREFGSASCSPELRDIALQVFKSTTDRSDRTILERAGVVPE